MEQHGDMPPRALAVTLAVLGLFALGCGSDDEGASGSAAQVTVFGCANETGTIGAIYMDIHAYCQPPGVGFYQCDELANRFMRDAFQHPNIDNVATDSAKNMCDLASTMSEYSVWGPDFLPTAGEAPVGGDLLVFWADVGHGHVVTVTGVDEASVAFMQQNGGSPVGTVVWDPGTSFFGDLGELRAECWIHPEPSSATFLLSGPDCGCFDGEGDYCGLSVVDHQAWFGCVAVVSSGELEYDTLYTCQGGVFTEKTRCSSCVTDWLDPAVGHCM